MAVEVYMDGLFLDYDTGAVRVDGADAVVEVCGHLLPWPDVGICEDMSAGVAGLCSFPESGARIRQLYARLHHAPLRDMVQVRRPYATTDLHHLGRVHPPDWQAAMRRLGDEWTLVNDTVLTPATWHTASLAADACGQMAWDATESRDPVLALVRPPGHHAGSRHVGGFCVFNNAAVAAAAMLEAGLDRVMILDWDFHHGDGTQGIFYDSDCVLYCSLHADSRIIDYPAGEPDQPDLVGEGDGVGFNLNLPLPLGVGDDDYMALVREVVLPVAQEYRPQGVVVSMGFDALRGGVGHPLLTMEQPGFELSARLFGRLAALAGRLAGGGSGPAVFVLEGGYEPSAVADGTDAVIRALADDGRVEAQDICAGPGPGSAVRPVIERARDALSPFWQFAG